jgi:pimeloyl-ACP methyl ester carboxylesterase
VFRRRSVAILGGDHRPLEGSISELSPLTIGGVEQWVMIRGVDQGQPLLLVIPDGPGETLIPVARRAQWELERAFTVVNWDPRGMGLSYRSGGPSTPLTLRQLTDDVVELARRLNQRFGRDRLVLAGHGFGSVVGLLAAAQAPELFEAYIGIAQWVEPRESERRALAWAIGEARLQGRSSLVRSLEGLAPSPDGTGAVAPGLRRAVAELGGLVRNPEGPRRARPALTDLAEYTILDLWHRREGARRTAATVGREAWAIDLPTRVTRLELPAYFVAGRYDRLVDPELAREYLRVLEAPRKGWAWVEETAHLAPFEDPEAYAAALAHFAHDARGPPAPRWAIAG